LRNSQVTPTKFGRTRVLEPFENMSRLHLAATTSRPLQTVRHTLRTPVLDQEDLFKQGIDTAEIVPGAPKVDALGSCVANATTAALSAGLTFGELDGLLPPGAPRLSGDPITDESFAIFLYHALTTQGGAEGWPPVDQGSSGLAACDWLEHQALIDGYHIAHGPENILSLMQYGPVITGQPWLNAWMQPGGDGFIDGDGSMGKLAEDIAGGVAGGHETCWYGIEEIGSTLDGGVDPATTVIRFRNSWSEAWGLSGDGLAHLSTFAALGHWCDFRQLRFAAE
jgi:hypothetical protein